MGGMWIALLTAYVVAFVKAGFFAHNWQLPLFIAGVLMIFFGSLLRRYCFRTLGKYFTGDVRAAADQPVISSGPYRLMRHPSYTAGVMMFIGNGLALGKWISLALLCFSAIATSAHPAALEERGLLAANRGP